MKGNMLPVQIVMDDKQPNQILFKMEVSLVKQLHV
jgi:hypothetical protein